MLQPPFLMDKWIVGLQQNQKIDYTVNYEASHRRDIIQEKLQSSTRGEG